MYRSSPFRSTLNTSYITGLDMCKVCTEAVHSVALWTRVTSLVWTCVKYVPKQSIPWHFENVPFYTYGFQSVSIKSLCHMSIFFSTYNSLNMTLFPNVCQSETCWISAKRSRASMVLFSQCIMDFLNQHITQPIIGLTSQQIIQLDQLCYPFDP